jgi:hypothetical protein
MREIKFRAWDKENKKMVFFNSIWNMPDPDYSEHSDLMQYTGLKDKNGKEIYCGDLMKNPNSNNTYEVVFEKGMFCFGNYEFPLWKGDTKNFWEVIGNIYDKS